MSLIKTNDLKKGTRVQLRNGWFATMADNARGNTRLASVEGYVTETGSIYAHDIVRAQVANSWVPVGHTKQQELLRDRITQFGY
jgi:hypothetical protein